MKCFSSGLFLFLFAQLAMLPNLTAQDAGRLAYSAYWKAQDSLFAYGEHSPLRPEAKANFDSVARFDYNPLFRVEAEWEPLEAAKPQAVATTTEAVRRMQKAGHLHFKLHGVDVALPVYRDLTTARIKMENPSLFVPFTDLSNGKESYAGGRYLDFDEAEIGRPELILDFNRAYNPYCVYNDRYSCPVPPPENHIAIYIRAGARAYK